MTEWEVGADAVKAMTADGSQLGVQFGWLTVPLFTPDGADADGDIARKIVDIVEMARRRCRGRIHAVVVRVGHGGLGLVRGDVVGIACMPWRPEPPVGTTLVARRLVVGAPSVDLTQRRPDGGVRDAEDAS